jgi:hypothetical protein
MLSMMKKPSLVTILAAITVVAAIVCSGSSSRAQEPAKPTVPFAEVPGVNVVPETASGYVRTIYGQGNSYFYLYIAGSLQALIRTTTSDPTTPSVYNYEIKTGPGLTNTFYNTTGGSYSLPNTGGTFTGIPHFPEMDPGSAAGAISLLVGGVLMLSSRRYLGS